MGSDVDQDLSAGEQRRTGAGKRQPGASGRLGTDGGTGSIYRCRVPARRRHTPAVASTSVEPLELRRRRPMRADRFERAIGPT